MKITLELSDSQVARLRELDRVVAPGWPESARKDLSFTIKQAIHAGILDMEERWNRELAALEEKQNLPVDNPRPL